MKLIQHMHTFVIEKTTAFYKSSTRMVIPHNMCVNKMQFRRSKKKELPYDAMMKGNCARGLWVIVNDQPRSQCVICSQILANEAMKLAKLHVCMCMASVRLRKTIDLSLLSAALGVADETNPWVAVSSAWHTHESSGAVLPGLSARSFPDCFCPSLLLCSEWSFFH